MTEKKIVFGEGVLKQSAADLEVFTDKNGNTYICDKKSATSIDRSKTLDEQNIKGCEAMPFDHGG
jgi:hypothetical protein